MHDRDFPGSPMVQSLCCQCRGAWVQSPVKELRSHMSRGGAKNKKTDEIKPETQHLLKKCIVKVFDNLPSKKQININGAGCFVGTWQDIVLMIDFMPW